MFVNRFTKSDITDMTHFIDIIITDILDKIKYNDEVEYPKNNDIDMQNIKTDNNDACIPKNKMKEYLDKVDYIFETTFNILESLKVERSNNLDLIELKNIAKKSFIDSIVDENNMISIRVTDELVNNTSAILEYIPKSIIDAIIHYDDIPKSLNSKKKQFTLDNQNVFIKKNKIDINAKSHVLILRNIFKNIHKLYFDFFDFMNDNSDIFNESIIVDNPIFDNYKCILYDKSTTNLNSIYSIYKSWDNTPYDVYKQQSLEYNRKKLLSLEYIKEGYISIVICVRNNLQYLKESITSVIQQTVDTWNIIIINDGSSSRIYLDKIFGMDFTYLKPFLNKIKIIENKEWNGIVFCQKQAIENANTEYIGILDSDDKLDPKCIEIVLDMYQKFKYNKNVFIFTNFYLTDRYFNILSFGFSKRPNKSLIQDGFALAFRTFKLRDYYKTTGYNPKFRYGGEDMDLLYKIEQIAEPFYIDKPLYYYRRFDNVSKPNNNLSITKYHKYNCLMARVINAVERFGNCFKIRIYSKLAKNDIEQKVYNIYVKHKKGLVYKLIEFYVELYVGNNSEVCLGQIPVGNINDIMLRPYLLEYMKTSHHEYIVFVKYSFQYNCLTIIDKSILFSIDDHLKININNLYDNVYISVNNHILNVDLNNIDENELFEYKKYILEKFYNEDNNLSYFHKLGVNYISFNNIKNIIHV